MTILEAIRAICEQIPGYTFRFDERAMFNVNADNQPFPCIFFEEYREGIYLTKYMFKKSTRAELYFSKLCLMENDATERETLRETIEVEAVRPFIKLYNESLLFEKVSSWKFYTPPPRFDANEVSVMLQWDAEMIGECL